MYSKFKRICPCCGKPLKLIPPTIADLPHRMDESANKVQYYFQCKMRFFSYNKKPRTGFVIPRDRGYFRDKFINAYRAGVPRGNDCFINTVPYTQKRIDKDGLSLFFIDRELVFLCKNCRQKLSINHNPFAFLIVSVLLWGFALMLTAMALLSLYPLSKIGFTLVALKVVLFIALFALMVTVPTALFVVVYYFGVKSYISNFVPTDEYDALIFLPNSLMISNRLLKKKFLHKSNIYETELNGERFCLYLTEKSKDDLKLHICGIDGEQERLLALIREKQNRGEKVTLPLTFEGKFVGNAEVIEIYGCIEEKTLPDDATQAKSKQNWRCDECGFTNSGTSSECKSCGKYRKQHWRIVD